MAIDKQDLYEVIEATVEAKAVNKMVNIWGTIIMVILFIPYGLVWGIELDGSIFLKFIAGYFVFILLHELLHLCGYVFVGKAKLNEVKLGVFWKHLMPYANCKVPLKISHYRIAVFMPVILGIGPLAYGYASGSGFYFTIGLVMTIGSYGDFVILWMIRNFRKEAYIQDHPSEIGCIVYVPK